MQMLKNWIRNGGADRFRNGRILNSLGMIVILGFCFVLTLMNVVFRLKLETAGRPPGSLEDLRNYSKPGAAAYHEERETLIKLIC